MGDAAADVATLVGHALGHDVDPRSIGVSRPGAGWSNDTAIVRLADATRLVVRRVPAHAAMFPVYDLRREYDCLRALAVGGAPVPAIIGEDLDGAVSGRSSFVMAFVDGRVPADDRPSFAEAGWLHDADRVEQGVFHRGLLDGVAAIHAVRPDLTVIASLRRPGPSACAGLLDDLATIWAFDRGEHVSPIIADTFDALRTSTPTDTDDVLLWGDARPANVITSADGFEPAAFVDFELAAWGPAELDLTWLAEMNRMRTTGSGVAPLPGFLDDDEAIAWYERLVGRRLDATLLDWSTRFNALKVAVLMHRHLRVTVHEGRLPPDHRVLRDNVATRRCADLA